LPNESPPPPSSEYVTVTRDVEVKHGAMKIVIPKGSKLLVVSHERIQMKSQPNISIPAKEMH
jgi:hypothetical protein